MSRWSHIAGVIRVDDWEETDKKRIRREGRRIIKFIQANAPVGSEGGLSFKLDINPNIYTVTRYVITVFGDLRGFGYKEDIELFVAWWEELMKSGLDIRNAIINLRTIDHAITLDDSLVDK
ncbi:MAG: hypothetical protein U9O94_06315 [Nanoarchaeota archaeon]|nr:hypothetical protein [Nanoarchaeota archaeon]